MTPSLHKTVELDVTSAPNCRTEADFHVLPERILASAGATLEWQESGLEEAREYIKKIPFVLRP